MDRFSQSDIIAAKKRVQEMQSRASQFVEREDRADNNNINNENNVVEKSANNDEIVFYHPCSHYAFV